MQAAYYGCFYTLYLFSVNFFCIFCIFYYMLCIISCLLLHVSFLICIFFRIVCIFSCLFCRFFVIVCWLVYLFCSQKLEEQSRAVSELGPAQSCRGTLADALLICGPPRWLQWLGPVDLPPRPILLDPSFPSHSFGADPSSALPWSRRAWWSDFRLISPSSPTYHKLASGWKKSETRSASDLGTNSGRIFWRDKPIPRWVMKSYRNP